MSINSQIKKLMLLGWRIDSVLINKYILIYLQFKADFSSLHRGSFLFGYPYFIIPTYFLLFFLFVIFYIHSFVFTQGIS